MLLSSKLTSSEREEHVFSEESIKGLLGKLYVTYNTRRTITSGKETITPPTTTEIRTELMLSYTLNGIHKYLGFRRTSLNDEKQNLYDGIGPVFNKQESLDKEVYLFLKKNLPDRMALLLPEIR